MAIGEAACVSVHGANRLGSNSLIDLVVFGKAAGLKCAETIKPGEKHREMRKADGEEILARLDRFRHANGSTPTSQLRQAMQKAMQADASVFRTGEILAGFEAWGARPENLFGVDPILVIADEVVPRDRRHAVRLAALHGEDHVGAALITHYDLESRADRL